MIVGQLDVQATNEEMRIPTFYDHMSRDGLRV